jgi:hypothetical protein
MVGTCSIPRSSSSSCLESSERRRDPDCGILVSHEDSRHAGVLGLGRCTGRMRRLLELLDRRLERRGPTCHAAGRDRRRRSRRRARRRRDEKVRCPRNVRAPEHRRLQTGPPRTGRPLRERVHGRPAHRSSERVLLGRHACLRFVREQPGQHGLQQLLVRPLHAGGMGAVSLRQQPGAVDVHERRGLHRAL